MSSIEQITVSNVRKVYGRHPALSGVSFALNPGQISLLLGPNGAGKSSLLGILSTLSRPTSGEVSYGSCAHVDAQRQMRGRIGLLSHEAMLYARMSCRENLHFFGHLHHLPNLGQEVTRSLEQMQLLGEADRPVEQLSRGLRQRAALACVLLPKPEILLLDEPFTGLDQGSIQLLRAALLQASQERRIILVVSHDIDAVDGLCDHLLVLVRGRLRLDLELPQLSRDALLEMQRKLV